MRRGLQAVWLAFVCLLTLLPASQAAAHATLIASAPADGAVIAAAPPALALTFNEPVSALVLKLIGPDGQAQALTSPNGRNERLEIATPGNLARGTHALSWRVISLDGHPVGGMMVFSIGEPSATAPQVRPQTDRAVAVSLWVAKLIAYAGLFIGIGGTVFLAWVRHEPAAVRGSALAVASGLVGIGVAVGLQGADALGLPVTSFAGMDAWQAGLRTTFGATAAAAAAAFALSLVSLRAHRQAVARATSLVALIGAGVALALSGHASAASPETLMRPAVFLHVVAVTFWIGALLPLWLRLRHPAGMPGTAAALARFSRAIPWAVAVLIASGSVLAVVQVGTPHALVMTAYGQILSAKLVLVVLLLLLAAWNRYRLTDAALTGDAGATRHLHRSIMAELAIVITVLGLVAGWRFTPPPRALATAAQEPALLHIHTDKAMADIQFEPGYAGPIRVTIVVMNGEFEELDAKEVQLTLENKAAGLEAISRPAVKGVDAAWRVEQLTIPQPGRWDVRVDVLVDDFSKVVLEDRVEISAQ